VGALSLAVYNLKERAPARDAPTHSNFIYKKRTQPSSCILLHDSVCTAVPLVPAGA
jgi:hypothetical protein